MSGRYRDDDRRRASTDAIQHFASQAAAFHERFEQGLNDQDLRGNVEHLWEDSREADQQLRQFAIPELRTEWDSLMQLLSSIRDAAGR